MSLDATHTGSVPLQSAPAQAAAACPWNLAYTKPKQEHIAELNLARQGYVTYLPRYKQYAPGRKAAADPSGCVREPMFPRYIFFRPGSPRQGVGPARSTRGVATLVSFGGELAAIDEQVIESIRRVEQERDCAELKNVSPFKPGRHVRLRDHGLKGLRGLVLSATNRRVTLLIDILGRQQMVEVSHDMLELE